MHTQLSSHAKQRRCKHQKLIDISIEYKCKTIERNNDRLKNFYLGTYFRVRKKRILRPKLSYHFPIFYSTLKPSFLKYERN